MTSVELRCRIDRVFGFGREVGKAWFDAARGGDLNTMKRLYKQRCSPVAAASSHDDGWRLLHYDGQGTSYGFVGSTALHWAAANNDKAMLTFLLAEGVSVNLQNLGGSTALHSAVANGSEQAVLLLLMHGANPTLADCCGDTPLDLVNVFENRSGDRATTNAMRAMLLAHAALMRLLAERDPTKWSTRDQSLVLSAMGGGSREGKGASIGVETIVERMEQLQATTARTDAKATSFLNDIRRRTIEAMSHPQDQEDRDEAEHLRAKAATAKQHGNDAFQRGEFREAVRHYTTAIALFPADYTFYSNRSASYLKLGLFREALKDASASVELNSNWAKGHHRIGCAWAGLGQWEKALSAYHIALQLVPDDSKIQQDIAQAQALLTASHTESSTSTHVAQNVGERKPWFDCTLCENKTRDKVVTPCCEKPLCGTCWKRRTGQSCPFCRTYSA